MSRLDAIMAQPLVYRLWQAPFAARKLAPVLACNDLRGIRRVLDVACGPGTNAPAFAHADYVGVDLNGRYLESARRRHRGRFVAADAIRWLTEATEQFDFILVNSFLHHLDDEAVRALLASLRARLAPGGTLHILELVLPPSRGVARTLARADRGKYARPLEAWRSLFQEAVRLDRFEPYTLSAFGVPLWEMVYGMGRAP
ncbi:MAG: class I SAM-dependent methyltransferase [Gemmatimonadales bacterium]